LAQRFRLRGGETLTGLVTASRDRKGRPSSELGDIQCINDLDPQDYAERPPLTELTPVDPREPIRFETADGSLSMRLVDLLTPIGRGQRGLIAAPPRTGKTILLQQMAAGVAANYPDMYLMVLLVDERPEEVTEMRRTVRGEVVASSNDQDVASHIRLARLMIEKAKRMVECGTHVFLLLDSLTRLGRAFNNYASHSGRIMSGGLDARALTEPKAIFGAARNIENGGSLTLIATALIETGSRMDEVIFNEFKGTGNMEIMLSRDLANKRIWPAINLDLSGTRKEELLLDPDALAVSYRLRREMNGRAPDRVMEMLLENLARHPDNKSFVKAMTR
jgi:transcription termination factor Rho